MGEKFLAILFHLLSGLIKRGFFLCQIASQFPQCLIFRYQSLTFHFQSLVFPFQLLAFCGQLLAFCGQLPVLCFLFGVLCPLLSGLIEGCFFLG